MGAFRKLSQRPARLLYLILLLFFALPGKSSDSVDSGPWSALLADCLVETPDGHSTAVDYSCFTGRRAELGAYLESLSAVSTETFDAWTKSDQLAFLINAYNAWTVELILTAWPDLESIRDLGSLLRSPWKREFIPLLGKTLSLDDIEHGMIREPGRFDDPRIHFAVNCASIGCPALRREAYAGSAIEQQLEDQTFRFLADNSRNRANGETLRVSSLFKWYRSDFEKDWRGTRNVSEFLARYALALSLSEAEASALANGDYNIEYLDYDWNLNRVP